MLGPRLVHRHPARNLQPVGVIGDGRTRPAEGGRRFDDLSEARNAVAPLRVHLHVAPVVGRRRPAKRRVLENLAHSGAAEKMRSQSPPALNISRLPARCDSSLDRLRCAGLEHFENDAGRGWSDPRDLAQRPSGADQLRQGAVELEYSGCRAVVSERLLLGLLDEREILKQTRGDRVDIMTHGVQGLCRA